MDLVITVRRGSPPTSSDDSTVFDVRIRCSAGHTVADALPDLLAHLGMARAHLTIGGQPIPPDHRLGEWPLVHGACLLAHAEAPSPSNRVSASIGTPFDLVTTAGPDCGRRIRLSHSAIVFGRSSEADLRADDPSLGRRQCLFAVEDGALTVTELASTNPTRLSGRALPDLPHPVTTADLVQAGHTRVQLRPLGPAPSRPREVREGREIVRNAVRRNPAPPPARLRRPAEPAAPPPRRAPWIALLVPLPVAGILALLYGPTFLLFSLIGPLTAGTSWWQDSRHRRRDQAETSARYARALAVHEAKLHEVLAAERTALATTAPDPDEVLQRAVLRRDLWTHPAAGDITPGDGPGGLPIRIGMGRADSTWVTVEAADGASEIPSLETAVVVCDLLAVGSLTVSGPQDRTACVLRQMLGGLVAANSPTQLEFEVNGSSEALAEQDWLRWLPHTHSFGPRGMGEDPSRGRPVRQMRRRVTVQLGHTTSWRDSPTVSHTIEVDGAGTSPEIGPSRVSRTARFGASLHLRPEGDLLEVPGRPPVQVIADGVGAWWGERLGRALAPLSPAPPGESGVTPHPLSHLGFSHPPSPREVESVVRTLVDQWSAADPSAGSRAVATVGCTGTSTWDVDLDRDGPHLLIGGTTGSGKSEVLRALLHGLALREPADRMTFLLIDYKGGSTFTHLRGLPHTVGVVTDLDPGLADRALRSLRAEIKRREALLKDSRTTTHTEHNRVATEVLPRLVIVVDEFRVLAQEHPAFLDGLVRLAAVGRALGLHLVLATQRPAGAITPDIQANVGLRIALRMRDDHESTNVIGEPIAARIDPDLAGTGYARSPDGGLTQFRAFHISEPIQEVVTDLRVDLVAPGELPSALPIRTTTAPQTLEEQITTVITHAHTLSGRPDPPRPWLPSLPETLHQLDLLDDTGATVGLSDHPEEQSQHRLSWSADDLPWRVVGGPRSGRSTALAGIITAASRAFPESLEVYAVSAAPVVRQVRTLASVGAVIAPHEIGRLRRLVRHLQRPEGGTDRGTRTLVVLDDWDALMGPDTTGPVNDLVRIATASGSSVSLVVAGGRALAAHRPLHGGPTICLSGLDVGDRLLLGLRGAGVSAAPGRGERVGDGAVVQLALPAEASEVRPARRRRPEPIEDLPTSVSLAQLREAAAELAGSTAYRPILGVGGDEPAVLSWDPADTASCLLVAGPAGSGRSTTLAALAEQARHGGMTVIRPRNAADVGTAATHPSVVVVDDIESVPPDLEAALTGLLPSLAGAGSAMVVAARTHSVASAFRGLLPQLTTRGGALLLQPARGHEGDPFGVRIEPPATKVPGRGVLIVRGRAQEVQVAMPREGLALDALLTSAR